MAGKKEDLINLILKSCSLFSENEEVGYIAFQARGRKQVERICSKKTKKLFRKIARSQSIPLSNNAYEEIIQEIESEAIFEGYDANIFNRIGKTAKGNILINPLYDDGKIIEISKKEWKITDPYTHRKNINDESDSIPVMVNTKGMLPLPYPEKGKGTLKDLEIIFRTKNDESKFLLIVSFIIQSYFFDGPFPILVIVAEPGSGKTFTTITIKNIIDPHVAPTLSSPRDPRDMFSTAGVSWLLGYDNFTKIKQWLSDLFCRFSTGGATIDRELYTNGEAYIAYAKRPCIVNGINDFFSQSDVLQRSIILENKPIEENERITEKELLIFFEDRKSGIFHDILDLLSKILKILPTINIDEPTRMADFCNIGEATAQSLGYAPGFFMESYKENLKQANDITLDSNVVSPVLKSFIAQKKYFSGSPSELLEALKDHDYESTKNTYWPKTAKVLSGTLKRLSQNFKGVGLIINHGRNHDGRFIEIKRANGKIEDEIPLL